MSQNPYSSPNAELVAPGGDKTILKFNRFSAWAVLGLTIITLGIYPIYWLYSRAEIINQNYDRKVPMVWLYILVTTTILSFATELFGETEIMIIFMLVNLLLYFVSYLVSLFTVRNRLQDIIQQSGTASGKVGPVLTFFFFTIYLQFKINQCLDQLVNKND